MKKSLIAGLLLVSMLVLLVGCGSGSKNESSGSTENAQTTETVDAEGTAESAEAAADVDQELYAKIKSVTINGVEITMGEDVAPVIAKLGDPDSYYEAASCAFNGLDKEYTYGGFVVMTYPDEAGGIDRVSGVVLTSDEISLDGIYIGVADSKVQQVYGDPTTSSDTSYIYQTGDARLTFLLKSGTVTSIEFAEILE